MEIRLLKANEIELKPQMVTEKGVRLVPYKDARADMRILDETFGTMNWQREHSVINNTLYCTVSIWDESKKQWIAKQDVGTESFTEKEKGAASDAFKRACVNIGIGRELYTSPDIWIPLKTGETYLDNKTQKIKLSNFIKFQVASINYDANREINSLIIVDQNGQVRYRMNNVNENNQSVEVVTQNVPQSTPEPITETFGATPTLAPTYSTSYVNDIGNMMTYHKEPYGNMEIQPQVEVPHYATQSKEVEQALDTIVKYGKYKSSTLRYIKENDPDYLNWLVKNTESQFLKDKINLVQTV